MSPRKVSVDTITILSEDVYSYEKFVSDLEVDTEKEISYQYSPKKGMRDDAHFAGVSMNYKGVLEPTATQTVYLYFLHMLGIKCYTYFIYHSQNKTGPRLSIRRRIKTAIIANEYAKDRLIREENLGESDFQEIIFRCDNERLNTIREKFAKIASEMDAMSLSEIVESLSEAMKLSYKTNEPFDLDELHAELSPKYNINKEETKDCLEFARSFMGLIFNG